MQKFILLIIAIAICSVSQAQEVLLISNPSFEVKPDAEDAFPRGWQWVDIDNNEPAIAQWTSDNKKPTHGQSYITLSKNDSTNQVISHNLSAHPLQAYRTYRLEIDASLVDGSADGKLQLIGYGKSIDYEHTLATSWEIDYNQWKKSILKFTPEADIEAIMLQVSSDNESATIALDNISNIERIIGPYDCDGTVYKNGYSRYELDPYESIIDGNKYENYEGKFHCVYTSFYTSKVLYDIFGAWDNIIYYEDGRNEKLLWNKIKLLDDSKEKYSVATSGWEDDMDIYTSIVVFDKDGTDLLNPDHPLSKKIMERIGLLIQENNEDDKDFYNFYAEDVGN